MTRFFSFLLIALGLSTVTLAQTANKTEWGVNIGYNAATVTTDSYTNTDYRSGFNIGLSADHYFSDRWSLKAKVIYDQKGWANGYLYVGNATYTTNYKLDYLTVPILANWHFGRTRNWYLNFGPYIAFLLNASESARGTDVKPLFNSVDGGLDLGIGIKFPVAPKAKLFLEVNGQGGASDMLKNNSGSQLRSSVSSFNIGVNF